MSTVMEEETKRWTAKRKAALVVEIIQAKTTITQASRAFDIAPSEIEDWVDEAKKDMKNALRAKPIDIREQYERQLKELQEAYSEAMLELRVWDKLSSLLGEDEKKFSMSSRLWRKKGPWCHWPSYVRGLRCQGGRFTTEELNPLLRCRKGLRNPSKRWLSKIHPLGIEQSPPYWTSTRTLFKESSRSEAGKSSKDPLGLDLGFIPLITIWLI